MTGSIQVPSIILPAIGIGVDGAFLGTESEAVADLLEHTSMEFNVEQFQEKEIHIVATEAVAMGIPGNLWCWVELSPYPTTTSAAYWAAIGGGGGALAPTAPVIVVGTGVPLVPHTLIIPWVAHSKYARLVVQTPVAAALPFAFWGVQAMFCGKR